MKRETRVDLPAVPSVVREELVGKHGSDGKLEPLHHVPLRGPSRSGSGWSRCASRPWDGRPMTFRPRVTAVEPGRRLEWLGHDGRSRALRWPALVHPDPGRVGTGTRRVQAEEFSGALIPFTGKLLGRTEAGFEAMNAALLTRLEKDQSDSAAAETL